MVEEKADKFAAGEQGLGYIYQGRFALLRLFELSEDTVVFLEKDDDVDFLDAKGRKTLGSLKHKAVSDKLSDLSVDFWKSVNIWLNRYIKHGCEISNFQFFLFTTSKISKSSFLNRLSGYRHNDSEENTTLLEDVEAVLGKTKSKTILPISVMFNKLSESQKEDFLERIQIFEECDRITDIPKIIRSEHMRSIRRENREAIFERLEGWWTEVVIDHLNGGRPEGISGNEVSDKLTNIAEEYTADNLPITFLDKSPEGEIDADADPRIFVRQLREIGVSPDRIRRAILDYYRAFEQRSAWARENLLISGEIEQYEERLADEWSRYKDVIFEDLTDQSAEEVLRKAGSELYKWAEFETGKIAALRIRKKVTEPYVVRGSFHILADGKPEPTVYWHPKFIERLSEVLEDAS